MCKTVVVRVAALRNHLSRLKLWVASGLLLSMSWIAQGQKTWDRGAGTDNWGDANNWNPDGVPTAAQTVTITGAYTINVNVNAVCASLTFDNNVNGDITLNIQGTNSLTIGGAVTFGNPGGNNQTQLINVGNGSLTCTGIQMANTTNATRENRLSITNGTVTVSGNINAQGNNNGENIVEITGNGTLNVGGTLQGQAYSYSLANNGTVNYTSTGAVTLLGVTYNNLTISGGGTKTINGNVAVNGVLNLVNGNISLGSGSYNLILNNSATLSGSFDNNHMIVCDGTGSLIRYSNTPAGFVMTYPVGTGTRYTPMTITSLSATLAGTESISVRTVASTAPGANATDLNRYWNVALSSGLSVTSADVSFTYINPNDVGTGGDQATYQPYIRIGTSWQIAPGASAQGVVPMSATSTPLLAGIWTAREAHTTFYSYQSGNWQSAATWTLDPSGTLYINPGNQIPSGANDRAVILNGRYVYTTTARTVASLTINEGGILDIFNSTGHNFGDVSGKGTLRLNTLTFPNGNFAAFVSTDGGTVEYYNVTGNLQQNTYNNLTLKKADNNANNYTITLASDLTVNGKLSVIRTAGSGLMTFTIGNDATARNIVVGGDLYVSNGGRINTVVANVVNTMSIGGNLTNYGTIRFTNRTPPVINAYYLNDPTDGVVNVTFVGASNNTVYCYGTTDFNRFIVNKGVDQTYILTVVSSHVDNFRIFGRNNQTATDYNPNIENLNGVLKNIWIRNGTLKLEGNILIPSLSEGGGDNFSIPLNGALWLNGPNVEVHVTNNQNGFGNKAITLFGKLRVDQGFIDFGIGAGLVYRGTGEIEINGGHLRMTQIRPSSYSANPKTSYKQTGGLVEVIGNPGGYEINDQKAIFCFPFPTNSFIMTGGTITVSYATTRGVFVIGTDPSNNVVTGGTINIVITNDNPYYFTSSAPIYNLNISKTGGTATTVQINNVNTDGLSGTPTSITTPAQPLTVLNEMRIVTGNNPIFNANNQNLYIGGLLEIQNGTTLNTGTNTVYFNGSGNQQLIVNGSVSGNFNHVTLSNGTSLTLVNASPATPIILNGNLTIDGGCTLVDNGRTLQVAGNIYNSGTHFKPVSGAGSIQLIGTANQIIGGNGNGIFNNLTLNKTGGSVTAQANFTVTGELRLGGTAGAPARLNMGSYRLNLTADANVYDAVTGTSQTGFSNNRMILTSGLLSDKGVAKTFNSSALSFKYPFGVQVGANYYYLPATIQFTAVPTSMGTVTIAPVKARHYLAQSTAALNCFWKTQSTGFSGIASGTLIQQYQYADAGPNLFVAAGSNELNYIPARYRYTATWFTDNDVNKVDDGNNTILFDTDTLPYGEYTAGELSAFGSIPTLYSVNDGAWNNPNTWSTSRGGPAGNGGTPNASTIVKIVDNHTVTTPVAAFAGSLYIEDGSVLDLGTVTGHNFTSLPDSGVVGTGKLRIASSNYFPQGDFGIFIGPNGGSVEYYTAGSNITVPVTSNVTNLPLTTYRNLVLTPGSGYNITLPATDLTVYGDLTVNGSGTGGNDGVRTPTSASYTYVINGNLNVNSGLLEYRNNVVQTIRVYGDVNIANGAIFRVNDGGTVVNNVLELYGNLQNNGTFDMNNTGRVYVYFKGTKNVAISGSGAVYDFYNLYVDKGTDYTSVLSLQSNITTGFTNPFLNLLNGTFRIDGAAVNVTLSTISAFTVPATACLSVNNGTATVGTTDNAGDLLLIGRLEVMGGTLNVGSGGNFNNDIEYASAGSPTIVVSGGTLNVNGQIRRNLNNTSGALIYTQSGGTVIINGQNQNVTRAKFEVLNASSSFTMTGGNIVVRQDGGTTYGDVYIRPSNYTVTGGTINFGDASTTAGKNFRLVAGIPLWNVEVGTDAIAQTVQLYILPLTVLNDLSIQGNSVFNAAGYNVTIRHALINENVDASGGINVGGYRPGSMSQVTTFNGSAPMSVIGNGANLTNFARLVLNSASSLTLQNNIQVNADLTLNAGTLADNGNQIVLKGNVYNAAVHSSVNGSGGIVFSGTSQQTITGSGAGVFGNVVLNNTFGIVMKDDSRINGKLTFTAGTLYIDDYQLTFGPDATIGGSPDATRCIVLNGALSDKGVRKYFNSGDTNPFTYPIGVSDKYTPVTFDFSSNDASNGYITVKPVNQLHPSVLNVNSSKLSYYWNVVSGGLNNYTVSHTYQYVQSDVNGVEADYEGERFNANAWSTVGTVNTTSNTISIPNVNYIDGEYTAGDQPNYSALPILYSRVASGNWNSGTSWSYTPGGSGPACGCTPNGNPVVIESGQTITIDANSAYAYSVVVNGILDVNNTVFHNLGHISGGGRIAVDATSEGVFVFPGGDYDAFLNTSTSTIELGGNVDATMPLKPGNYYKPYNHLELTGTGRKYISAENIRIKGNLSIANGTVLDNSQYDKNVSILGSWNDANASVDGFVPGQGSVIFEGTSQQNINTQLDENFYNLQINNGAGVVITGNGNVVVSNILTLTNGIVSSSTIPQRMVRISNTSTSAIVGGGSNAFVACPLSKNIITGQSFTFPVGDGSRYGYMSLLNTSVSSSPQYWTVKYYNANPSPTYPTDASHLQSPITGVSNNEYWVVTRPTGGSANIRLRWDANSYPAYTGSSALRSLLRVVEYGSGVWTERSNASGVSGNAVSGTITTNTPVTADDYVFTIGVSGVTATITDATSVEICNNGEVASIPVSLTGTAPWTLTYRTTGTPTHTYVQSGISSNNYTIQLTGYDIGGTGNFVFSLISVVDGNNMSGVCSNTTKQITVKTTYIPVISGPSTVGSGETRSYSTPNHTGSTYLWSWQGASGGTIQSPNANATNIVFGAAGTYTLRVTETYNGCSAYTDKVIVVQNVPAPDITPSTANVCQNDIVNYSTAAVTGHEYFWTVTGGSCTGCGVWTTSNTISVTWTTPGTGSVSVIESTDGTHSVTGTDTKYYNVSASINSYTVSAASATICENSSTNILLSGSQVGVTYQLRNNADNSSVGPSVPGTGGALSFPTGTLTATTTYNILAYNSGCQLQMTGTPTVTVQPLPTITLSTGVAEVCYGNTSAPLAYTATTQSPTHYSIDFDAAANAAGINDVSNQSLSPSPIVIAVPNNIAPNTYNGTLTVSNALCVSGNYAIQVVVHNIPSGSLTSSDSDNEICAGDNVTFTATGGVNYHFYLNSSSVQNGASNTYSTTTLSNGDTVTVVVTDTNGCSATYPGITITVHPVPSVNPVTHN